MARKMILSKKYLLARRGFSKLIQKIQHRALNQRKRALDLRVKNSNTEIGIKSAITSNFADVSMVHCVTDGEWIHLMDFLHQMRKLSVNKLVEEDLRNHLESAVCKLCGKQNSDYTVHDILVNHVKLLKKVNFHEENSNQKNFFIEALAPFCADLHEYEEYEEIKESQFFLRDVHQLASAPYVN